MKKLWNILLCAALLCSLCACGGERNQTTAETGTTRDAGEPISQDNSAPAEAEPPQAAEPDEAPEDGQELDGDGQSAAPDETPEEKPEQTPASVQEEKPPAPPEKPEERQAPAGSIPAQAEKPEEKPEDPARPKEQPKPEQAPAPAEEAESAEKPEPTQPAPEVDRKTIAEGLVGRPVSELYAAIGRPISFDYAPSCLIDGEDGELIYDGFTVYTEKGADYETVYAVF